MKKEIPAADCIFCKIINGEIPSQIVFENENFVAFNDLHPKAPIHILIIPKKHFATLEKVDLKENYGLMEGLLAAARSAAAQFKISDNYQLNINVGLNVQQIHHLHLHLKGGWEEKDIPN